MKSNNGYLIAETFRISKILKRNVFVINCDGKEYYFKGNIEEVSYKEVLASKMLKKAGFDIVEYNFAMLNNMSGVISADMVGDYNYLSGYDLLKEKFSYADSNNNLENIWYVLYEKYHDTNLVKELMSKIVDCYIASVLLFNTDVHEFNWGILSKDEEVKVAPLFDFDHAFSSFDSTYFTINSSSGFEASANLKIFLDISDSEFNNRFRECFRKLNVNLMDKCMQEIEAEGFIINNKYKEKLKYLFEQKRLGISDILSSEERGR